MRRSRPFKAMVGGRCAWCDEQYAEGESIVRLEGQYVHEEPCAEEMAIDIQGEDD